VSRYGERTDAGALPPFLGESYADWCGWLFGSLADRGTWTVPRSGLTFQKREAERELVLVGLIIAPGVDTDPEADFAAIRDHFAEAGITVRKGE
jgi:hypothetical protein